MPYRIINIVFNSHPQNTTKPIHVHFCIVDHFEPGTNNADSTIAIQRVKNWLEKYPTLASKHRDADGRHPQHTWFFPPHYDEHGHLRNLVTLCKAGFGEIELHLHHGGENSNTLKQNLRESVSRYSELGIFGTLNGTKAYGFIHGKSALDNSRNGEWCGVNNELQILRDTGCYADFTFPCMNKAQPRKTNTIYYAIDDPYRPKSYNTGIDVRVGSQPQGDLMLIQGPLGLRWRNRNRKLIPNIERAAIDATSLPVPGRIDYWIKSSIHVKGKPNWIFVKVHTHGAPEENQRVLLGEPLDEMYGYLESKYNDGENYVLHYVTAREMFNIIKAAEASEGGNPRRHRDYLVSPPNYL